MPIHSPEFVRGLIAAVPEAESTLREHLGDNEGSLLLHLLVADLRRLALAWFVEGRSEALQRLLQVVATGLREGDELVEGAMVVSFVGDAGWWEPEVQPFIAVWPDELKDEIAVQRQIGTVNRRPRNPTSVGDE